MLSGPTLSGPTLSGPAPSAGRRRRRSARRLALFLLTAAVSTLLPATLASASSRPRTAVTPHQPFYIDLPGTVQTGAASCAPSGYCLIGGQARGASGNYGFVAQVINGVVGRYHAVPGMAYVSILSCPQTSWCLAFGFGTPSGGLTPDEVSVIANNVPGTAAKFGTNLPIRGVGCENSTTCYVVGSYNSEGLIQPYVNGVLQQAKTYAGPLFTAISCPPSLKTCVVVGTNNALDKTRVAYVTRITGTAVSNPSVISGGMQAPAGIWCTAYYSCQVTGLNTVTKEGAVETLAHVSASHLVALKVGIAFGVACATSSLCATTVFSSTGHWGYVPLTNGTPGTFVDVTPNVTTQQMYAIACQGAAHCYQDGYTTNKGQQIGILERFSLGAAGAPPTSRVARRAMRPFSPRPFSPRTNSFITPAGSTAVPAASCAPSGYCLIGGSAVNSKQKVGGFVAQVINGLIGKEIRIKGLASVQALSCPQNQWCLAYGFGSTSGGLTPDRVSVVAFGFPAAVQTIGNNLQLHAVGCESATNCFVVGSDNGNGLIVPVINGKIELAGEKHYTGVVFSGIDCPESLGTCVVVGSNRAKPRVSFAVRITGASISATSKTSGLQVLTGVWCSAYYTCLAVGFNAVTKTGGTETLSHLTGSNIKTTAAQFVFDTTCASASLCVTVSQTHSGNWGYEGITSGTPGAFVPIMPVTAKQSLSAVACQNASHCYETGYTTSANGPVGVLERFSI
jgi:hypothetical protein